MVPPDEPYWVVPRGSSINIRVPGSAIGRCAMPRTSTWRTRRCEASTLIAVVLAAVTLGLLTAVGVARTLHGQPVPASMREMVGTWTAGGSTLQLDETGIAPVAYDDTDLVTAWRSFLQAPDRDTRLLQ